MAVTSAFFALQDTSVDSSADLPVFSSTSSSSSCRKSSYSLGIFVPPSGGDLRALERAPVFGAFSSLSSSASPPSSSGGGERYALITPTSPDLLTHGGDPRILWAGDGCPSEPSDITDEDYSLYLSQLRQILLHGRQEKGEGGPRWGHGVLTETRRGGGGACDDFLANELLLADGADGFSRTPPVSWRKKGGGRRVSHDGKNEEEKWEDALGGVNVLTEEGFRILYCLAKGFSIPRTSGGGGGELQSSSEGGSMLIEDDDPTSSPPRRSLRLQKDFLELLADLCRRAERLSACLPSESNPSGHGSVLRVLRDRQRLSGGHEEGLDRMLATDGDSENVEESRDLLYTLDGGVSGRYAEGRKDGFYNRDKETGVASGETVIEAARAVRSLLLCVIFFADYVVQQALKQIENEGVGNTEGGGGNGTGGRGGGRRGVSGGGGGFGGGSGKSKRRLQASGSLSRTNASYRPTPPRGGGGGLRGSVKRRRNEQMDVTSPDGISPPGRLGGDIDEIDDDVEGGEPTQACSRRGGGHLSGDGGGDRHEEGFFFVQLSSLLKAVGEVAVSPDAWRPFDTDLGGERDHEGKQRMQLVRCLLTPLRLLCDEEKLKGRGNALYFLQGDEPIGRELRDVLRFGLVGVLIEIETRRERYRRLKREEKKRWKEQEEARERERERNKGGGADSEEEQDTLDSGGGKEQAEGKDSVLEKGTKTSTENEGEKREEEEKEDQEEDDEEEEGQMWMTELNNILLRPECRALVEILSARGLRHRRLASQVLRELIQQLKEQLLLCGSVERATAAQKRSFLSASGALEEFAARLPRVWLREKELLLQLFAADAYHIRKALSECLRILILKAHRIVDLHEEEEEEQEEEEPLSEGDAEDRRVGSEGDEAAESARFSRRRSRIGQHGGGGRGDEDSRFPSTHPDGESRLECWMEREDEKEQEGEDGLNVVCFSSPKVKKRVEEEGGRERTYRRLSMVDRKKNREKAQQKMRSFWSLQRVGLVNELLSRLEDKTPLARTWALKVLADLLGEKEALPVVAAVRTVQAASERLLDKSTMVRCAALGVFGALVHLAAKQHQATGGVGRGMSPAVVEQRPFLLLLISDEDEWEEMRHRMGERKKEQREKEKMSKGHARVREGNRGGEEEAEEDKEVEVTNEEAETKNATEQAEGGAAGDVAAARPSEGSAPSGERGEDEAQGKKEEGEERKQGAGILEMDELVLLAEDALSKAIDVCGDLLFSRTEGDQKAALRFLIDSCLLLQLRRRRLLPALQGALRLAFSRSAAVSELLVQEFLRLFLDLKSLEQQQLLLHEQWASRRAVRAHLDAIVGGGGGRRLREDSGTRKSSTTSGRGGEEQGNGGEEEGVLALADENTAPLQNQCVDSKQRAAHSSSSPRDDDGSASTAQPGKRKGGRDDGVEGGQKTGEMTRRTALADPLFLLLLRAELNSGVNGAYRFGVGRLLELVADGDMTVLACIEKVFFLALSGGGSSSSSGSSSGGGGGGTTGTGGGGHQPELKKAADSFFSLAMQPDILFGRDTAMLRCALGLLRLLFQASHQTSNLHSAHSSLLALPFPSQSPTSSSSSGLVASASSSSGGGAMLHRLSTAQLLTLQGAILQHLKHPGTSDLERGGRTTRSRLLSASAGGVGSRRGNKEGEREKPQFLVVAELCRILTATKPDGKTSRTASLVLNALMVHYGTKNVNWFSAAQAVIDLTFAHCPRPEQLWTRLLSSLLSHLLQPSAPSLASGDPRESSSSPSLSKAGGTSLLAICSSQLNTPAAPTPLPSSTPRMHPPLSSIGSRSSASQAPHLKRPWALPKTIEGHAPSLWHVAHLVFLAGHVALRVCILLEQQQSDVKQARSKLQQQRSRCPGEKKKRSKKTTSCGRDIGASEGAGEADADDQPRGGGRSSSNSYSGTGKKGGSRNRAFCSSGFGVEDGGEEQRKKTHDEDGEEEGDGEDDEGEEEQEDSSAVQTVEGNMGMQTKEEEEAEMFAQILEQEVVGTGLLGGPLKRLILIAAFEPQRLIQRTMIHSSSSFSSAGGGGLAPSTALPLDNKSFSSPMRASSTLLVGGEGETPVRFSHKLTDSSLSSRSSLFPQSPAALAFSSTTSCSSASSFSMLDYYYSSSASATGVASSSSCSAPSSPSVGAISGLPELHAAAVISLCKYATVSRTFCESQLCKTTTILHALLSLLFSKTSSSSSSSPAFSSSQQLMNATQGPSRGAFCSPYHHLLLALPSGAGDAHAVGLSPLQQPVPSFSSSYFPPPPPPPPASTPGLSTPARSDVVLLNDHDRNPFLSSYGCPSDKGIETPVRSTLLPTPASSRAGGGEEQSILLAPHKKSQDKDSMDQVGEEEETRKERGETSKRKDSHSTSSVRTTATTTTTASYRLPSALRQTLLICYGDLTCRHPNVLEPYNNVVFNILQDDDAPVRHAAVQVFTHLIMNGMIKPKGRLLVLIFRLLRDTDPRIKSASEIFFYEVERKGSHAIVNHLPELLAALAEATLEERRGEEGELRGKRRGGERCRDENRKKGGTGGRGGGRFADGPKKIQKESEGEEEEEEDEEEEEEGRGGEEEEEDEERTSSSTSSREEQQRLLNFLLQFVKHHRHSRALIEKICQRIAALPIPRHLLADLSSSSSSSSPPRAAMASDEGSSSSTLDQEKSDPCVVLLQGESSVEALRSAGDERQSTALATASRRIYFQALKAVCLSSQQLEKALRKLSSCFPLIRFAVAIREEGGGEDQLKDLLRRVAVRISGRGGSLAGGGGVSPASSSSSSAPKGSPGGGASGPGRRSEEGVFGVGGGGGGDAGEKGVDGGGGSGGGAQQDIAAVREVMEELHRKLQAATEEPSHFEEKEEGPPPGEECSAAIPDSFQDEEADPQKIAIVPSPMRASPSSPPARKDRREKNAEQKKTAGEGRERENMEEEEEAGEETRGRKPRRRK